MKNVADSVFALLKSAAEFFNLKNVGKRLLVEVMVVLIAAAIVIPPFYSWYVKKIGYFTVAQLRINVPEGLTVAQIGEKFKRFPNFDINNFLNIATPEEGRLFPDTYYFDGIESEEEIIRRMEDNFVHKAGVVGDKDLIMASILEKEAKTLDDKKIISGILWKRMKVGMPLQVDATLVYLFGKTSKQLTLNDLKINSPYNTYLYKELPPAPISNPGLESIEAARRPKESPYWYYLSDAENKIHFAKTFEEHKINKAKYLR